jgi:uncharacterized membrane protein YhaH (DUF805 family)
MKLRPLLENPFRNYAVFSGRAGRAEFWLFILTFVVITQLAWLIGFGVMKIAGFDEPHNWSSEQNPMGQSEYDDAATSDAADTQSGGQPGDSSSANDGSSANSASQNSKADDNVVGARPDRRYPPSPTFDRYHSDRHDDMMNFMIHRHGRDGYHLHGIIRDDHMFEYDGDEYDGDEYDGKDFDRSDDHRRYQYDGRQRGDRHLYVRFHKSRAERGGDILWLIGVAALLLPLIAVGARRLHDSNHSGWWQLLALIPGAGWLVLLIFFLLPGEEDDNRFGPPSIV